MTNIVEARSLFKSYGNFVALDNIDLCIPQGAISGLIGPNGAGKTTALKSLIGLCDVEGDISVAGRDPRVARHKLMSQVLEYVEAVHPQFNRSKAERFLSTTEIPSSKRIKNLSKGMVTQLHLAIVMAIEVSLLVLDEPTLGLDIIYRKEFYDRLLNDYYDGNRTILISTHQVEEIETLLSHLIFIDKGKIVLNANMADIADIYAEVLVDSDKITQADALNPIYIRNLLGKKSYTFESVPRAHLEPLGGVHTPSVADLFVAKMRGQRNESI
jgi:ABC-2 type transport system ATP-binding protein